MLIGNGFYLLGGVFRLLFSQSLPGTARHAPDEQPQAYKFKRKVFDLTSHPDQLQSRAKPNTPSPRKKKGKNNLKQPNKHRQPKNSSQKRCLKLAMKSNDSSGFQWGFATLCTVCLHVCRVQSSGFQGICVESKPEADLAWRLGATNTCEEHRKVTTAKTETHNARSPEPLARHRSHTPHARFYKCHPADRSYRGITMESWRGILGS